MAEVHISEISLKDFLKPQVQRLDAADTQAQELEKTTKKLPSKKLMKKLLAGAQLTVLGGTLLTGATPQIETTPTNIETQETVEFQQVPGPKNLTMIDTTTSWRSEELQKKALTQLKLEVVPTDALSPLHNSNLLTNDNYAASYLLNEISSQFLNHGASMQEVVNQNLTDAESEQMNFFPLQEAITNYYFRRDELGNPVVGVYIDPEVIDRFIKNSPDKYISMSFQVGWTEYSLVLSERRFPKLFPYILNGEEVFSVAENLTVTTDENGQEILVENVFTNIDTSQLPNDEKARFLITEAYQWSPEEYAFLVSGGYIDPADGFPEGDIVWNDSANFLYPPGSNRDAEPIRSAVSNPVFSRSTKKPAPLYTPQEAAKITSQGELVSFDTPKSKRTEAYEGTFQTPNGEVTAVDNQESLYTLASNNPDKILIVALGNQDSSLDIVSRPSNLFAIGLYMRGATLKGGNFYVYPNPTKNIESSSAATAHIAAMLTENNPEDAEEFLTNHSTEETIWRNTTSETREVSSYEEVIDVIR